MKTIFILCCLFITSASFAKTITPVEDLGTIVVHWPDISSFPQPVQDEFNQSNKVLRFTSQNKYVDLKPDKTYSVNTGTGCLQVSVASPVQFGNNDCTIKVEPSRLTEVFLSAVHLTWADEPFKVDLGPQAFITLSHSTGALGSLNALGTADEKQKNLFITNAGKHTSKVSHPSTLLNEEKQFDVQTGQSLTVDVTPPDHRTELQIEILDAPATFPLASNYITVAYRIKSPQPGRSIAPWSLSSYGYGPGYENNSNSGVESFYNINPHTPVTKLKVFPLNYASIPYFKFEVIVNETATPLRAEPKKVGSATISTLNVDHYQSGKPGVYKLSRKTIDPSGEVVWAEVPRTDGAYIYATTRPTQTSVSLLNGHEYLFEFFIVDDLKNQVKQDEIIVDLSVPIK